nr:MAG TPA: hypothetical protein [Myoviridae sp. ctNPX13]
MGEIFNDTEMLAKVIYDLIHSDRIYAGIHTKEVTVDEIIYGIDHSISEFNEFKFTFVFGDRDFLGEIKIVNGYKLETRILSLRTLDTVSKNFSRPDVLDWYINTVLDKVVNEKVIDINKLIGC